MVLFIRPEFFLLKMFYLHPTPNTLCLPYLSFLVSLRSIIPGTLVVSHKHSCLSHVFTSFILHYNYICFRLIPVQFIIMHLLCNACATIAKNLFVSLTGRLMHFINLLCFLFWASSVLQCACVCFVSTFNSKYILVYLLLVFFFFALVINNTF